MACIYGVEQPCDECRMCEKGQDTQAINTEKTLLCNCDGCKNNNTDECIHCIRAYSDCYENRRMMREILFRGRKIDNGEWVEGYFIEQDYPEYHAYIVRSINLEISDDGTEILQHDIADVESSTVCQYTGLTDKNGRKIFEGDIVKYHFGEDVASVRFGTYQSCFDSQKTEHCGFYIDWKTEKNLRKDLGYWVHMVDAEIVGNIFDNADLMKG